MASAVVKYYAGLSALGSITCTLYAKGSESGASAASITLTELGSSGCYSGTTSAGLSGLYWAILSGGMVDGGFVEMSDDTSDHVIQAGVFDWDTNNQVGHLGTATVNVTNAVDLRGNITLITGMDYYAVDGLSLDFTDTGGTWADLAGATAVNLWIKDNAGVVLGPVAGSFLVRSGSNKKVRFELSRAQTNALPPAPAPGTPPYKYLIAATLVTAHDAPLQLGVATVLTGAPTS